ncbi:MAG TPA: hypothetical protein VJZ27_06365 [Aggregatilineales bacterium]|nr:hypothetical protein [Aggregatilineales bacterium]
MASQYRAIGKDGYVSFQGTEVSADYRNFDVELTIDTIEKSAGSEASKSYIATLKDGTAKLTYAYSGTAGTAYTSLLRVGQQGTLLWGAEGNGTGKPKGGVEAIVIAHSKPMAYNDLVTRTASFQFTGNLLFDDEVNTWA